MLKEALGEGPLGAVHRGEDRVDGRSVCLRVLAPQALSGDGLLHGLALDLKAAAQVSHPNLAKVIGFVEIEGRRCVVSELVPGRNFAQALSGGKKMPVPQVHSLGRVLAQLLGFLHGKGLVHGTLQPSNIMVANGVVRSPTWACCAWRVPARARAAIARPRTARTPRATSTRWRPCSITC
jgi:serine/threonine protein kinase